MPWPMIVAFLAPGAAALLGLRAVPDRAEHRYSLYDWNGLGPLDNFVGLDNFRTVFGDDTSIAR